MTQENKELLLKDLGARLPYGVIIQEYNEEYGYADNALNTIGIGYFSIHEACIEGTWMNHIENVRPYLRPMSSMTKKERKELNNQGYTKIAGEFYHYCALSSSNAFYNPERHPYVRMEYVIKLIDWLNAHHFDYRELIEKGLAIEAPKGMYKN